MDHHDILLDQTISCGAGALTLPAVHLAQPALDERLVGGEMRAPMAVLQDSVQCFLAATNSVATCLGTLCEASGGAQHAYFFEGLLAYFESLHCTFVQFDELRLDDESESLMDDSPSSYHTPFLHISSPPNHHHQHHSHSYATHVYDRSSLQPSPRAVADGASDPTNTIFGSDPIVDLTGKHNSTTIKRGRSSSSLYLSESSSTSSTSSQHLRELISPLSFDAAMFATPSPMAPSTSSHMSIECATPFSPSSPPMSPSPMAALATHERLKGEDVPMIGGDYQEDMGKDKPCGSVPLDRSLMETVLQKVRSNIMSDALLQKTHKSTMMLTAILKDVPAFFSDPAAPTSPRDSYMPHDDEDLASMYIIHPSPAAKEQARAAVQQQPSQATLKYSAAAAALKMSRVITFTKAEVAAAGDVPSFHFVKERVPKRDYNSSPSSSLFYNEFFTDSESTHGSTTSASCMTYDNTYSSTATDLAPPATTAAVDSPKQPAAQAQVPPHMPRKLDHRLSTPISPISGQVSPRGGHHSSTHNRSFSHGVIKYPWSSGRMVTIRVFVPTNPTCRVDLTIEEDASADRVVGEVIEMCVRERRRTETVAASAHSGSGGSNAPVVQTTNSSTSSRGSIIPVNSSLSGESSTSNSDDAPSFSFLTTINPRAFMLRIANRDGSADEDYLPLDKAFEIRKAKTDTFVLQPNPRFIVKESVASQAAAVPPIFRVHIVATAPPTHAAQRLSLNASNGVKDSIAVPYCPTTTLSAIKATICKKERYSEDLCVFMSMFNEVICNESITLEELGVGDIKLIHDQVKSTIPKSVSFIADSGNAPRPITKLLGPMFFFTPATAGEYKKPMSLLHQ
eukprot:gene18058-21570_t